MGLHLPLPHPSASTLYKIRARPAGGKKKAPSRAGPARCWPQQASFGRIPAVCRNSCPGAAAAAALLLVAAPAAAQLRPLEPLDWSVFDGERALSLRLGSSILASQRASLAGTAGRLLELGDFALVWRTGRVALEAGGTVQRLFREDEVFAPPTGGALAEPDGTRHDSGDYRVATAVRLTGGRGAVDAAVRFGTRLPTTDNEVGLDRDQTDFFALLAARLRRGLVLLAAEGGLGVFGTRSPRLEQVDIWVYALSAEYDAGPVTPSVALLGQANGLFGPSLRGNEDLSELRLGLRVGGGRWVRLSLVRGLTEFSPSAGLLLTAGLLLGAQN